MVAASAFAVSDVSGLKPDVLGCRFAMRQDSSKLGWLSRRDFPMSLETGPGYARYIADSIIERGITF